MSAIGEGLHSVPHTPVQSLLYQPPKATALSVEATQRETKGKEQHASQEEVEKIISDINTQLHSMHTELNFSIDKDTNRMVLKIINSETDEVIRQIPAEEALRIASRLSKLLGLLVDHTA